MKKYKFFLIAVLLAVFSTFIIFNAVDYVLMNNSLKILKTENFISLIVLSTFYYVCIHKGIKFRKSSLIVGLIISFFWLFGKAIHLTTTFHALFESFKNIVITILAFSIFAFIIYILLANLYHFLDNHKYKKKRESKIYNFIFEKHPILIPFLIILICGIPYIILFYPGTVQWDGLKQLNYFFGIEEWSNHHPVLPTVIMGILVKIGRTLVNDNFGVFLFTFTQFLFSSFVFAYIINFIRKLKAPKWLMIFSLLFFSLLTMWPINAYTLVKDTYYYLFILLYVVELMKFYFNKDKEYKLRNYIPLLIISILIALFRNNGIYIVIFTLIPFLFLINKKSHKAFSLSVVLITFSVNMIFNSLILNTFNISQTHIREALSIPIQQVARYIREYKNELTDDERRILENIFPDGLDVIKKRYIADISDPVKFRFRADITTEELKEFFGVWSKLLVKHPMVYVDAFLENYYGYVYPEKKEYKDGLGWYEVVQSDRVNTGYFDFKMIEKFADQREYIELKAYDLRAIPILGLFYSCGFYTWVLVIALGYLLEKFKIKSIIPLLPLIGTLLICFISPVNAYIRYMQPIMVALPLFSAYVICHKEKPKNT